MFDITFQNIPDYNILNQIDQFQLLILHTIISTDSCSILWKTSHRQRKKRTVYIFFCKCQTALVQNKMTFGNEQYVIVVMTCSFLRTNGKVYIKNVTSMSVVAHEPLLCCRISWHNDIAGWSVYWRNGEITIRQTIYSVRSEAT